MLIQLMSPLSILIKVSNYIEIRKLITMLAKLRYYVARLIHSTFNVNCALDSDSLKYLSN